MTKKEFNKLVGEAIREARHARGMSMAELGKRVNLSAMALSYIEHGHNSTTAFTLFEIVKILHIQDHMTTLMYGE